MDVQTAFTEVSKDVFYATIGPQNVVVSIVPGPYPYTSEFITPSHEVRGRKVGYLPDGEALAKHRYFLSNTNNKGQR
jgi:hypothetical protein